ncbi:30S ribosomal protein S18 [Mycolicibacter minnesotensis]|uniref:Small ribosomal subunit protein bS18 n=1 Tax=Mycolicibacter minnesotensis TaxID=1118379 RepID=A0A7I7R743_9MYCO|nr:30S ribosomal protein S18 [Mycolicibacter minnesotensis]ORA99568.1 30S ribosomal protein S18 [Mycolicibacter minnesotensis]BBY34421.1 30S ribosomal protein S18 [Mycolicibacter minnesotensis]
MAVRSPGKRRIPQRPGRSAKPNLLTKMGLTVVDYKDTATLRTFISPRGKIRSRDVTGLTVRQQRQVAGAIKNAREMALLPYPGAVPE